MDQCRVEDPEVEITTCMLQRYLYTCTRTTKFAHMNGHWKAYDNDFKPEELVPNVKNEILHHYETIF